MPLNTNPIFRRNNRFCAIVQPTSCSAGKSARARAALDVPWVRGSTARSCTVQGAKAVVALVGNSGDSGFHLT